LILETDMPVIEKTRPVLSELPQPGRATGNGVLSTVVSAVGMRRSWMKVLLYGRSRVGKSTLSAQWPKPLLAVACEPRENGGADSLIGMEGVSVCAVGLKPAPGEMTGGSLKAEAVADALLEEYRLTGKCPYQTVTLDVTALQDIVLAEILGWTTVDNILKRPRRGETGGASFKVFGERASRCIGIFRKYKELPCHVIFCAQEKDHNPEKDEDGNAVGSKLVREAQEKSFIAASLGQASVEWLQNACQFVCQLYMAMEIAETTTTVDVAGVPTLQTVRAATGKFIRRLRTAYHPNYSAGITAPGVGAAPEYIEAARPEEMYEALMEVAAGRRTPRGKYA
jgi:hypothetical protein